MPHVQSQLLKGNGKAWQTLSMLVSAVHDAGGEDYDCRPMWSSREFARNVAAVLMGRMKFVECSLPEIARQATLTEDRLAAVQQLDPVRDGEPLWNIAEQKQQHLDVRLAAIKRCSSSDERFADLARSTDVAGVAEAAISRVTNVTLLNSLARSARLEHAQAAAIEMLGQLDSVDSLISLASELAPPRLVCLAVQNVSDESARRKLESRPAIRRKLEAVPGKCKTTV
jgi:hypothetical protein